MPAADGTASATFERRAAAAEAASTEEAAPLRGVDSKLVDDVADEVEVEAVFATRTGGRSPVRPEPPPKRVRDATGVSPRRAPGTVEPTPAGLCSTDDVLRPAVDRPSRRPDDPLENA